jgi:hypothetical protein
MIRQSVGGLTTRSCANLTFLERDSDAKPGPLLLIAPGFRMRFAPEPVKLRIANVCRPGIYCGQPNSGIPEFGNRTVVQVGNSRAGSRAAILARKNPADIDIFGRISSFRRCSDAANGGQRPD